METPTLTVTFWELPGVSENVDGVTTCPNSPFGTTVTGPENPLMLLTVTVKLPADPLGTSIMPCGVVVRVKSGCVEVPFTRRNVPVS